MAGQDFMVSFILERLQSVMLYLSLMFWILIFTWSLQQPYFADPDLDGHSVERDTIADPERHPMLSEQDPAF